jgi:hypothetical protein
MRLIGALSLVFTLALTLAIRGEPAATTATHTSTVSKGLDDLIVRAGKLIFRFDTFGDEQFWTDVLRMDEAIAQVDPETALAVGLKVDVTALPASVIAAIRADDLDLKNPAVTIELLRLNAVLGVRGRVNEAGQLTSIGVTCALCHSTVDDSLMPVRWKCRAAFSM